MQPAALTVRFSELELESGEEDAEEDVFADGDGAVMDEQLRGVLEVSGDLLKTVCLHSCFD
jgi:hypothetical protein